MHIITDSSTLFSPSDGEKLGITVIPACTIVNGETYKDYEEISCEKLLEWINKGAKATTSQPSIGDILDIFQKDSEEILMLTIGDGLSGGYQCAMGAKNCIEDNERIHVVDTRTLAGPQRYLVKLALQMNHKGVTIEKIKEELQKRIETSVSFVIPSDFEFLRRSGRLTPIAAKLGGILKIVPVLTQTKDMKRIEVFSIKRSRSKALDTIVDYFKKTGMDDKCLITISHAGVPGIAQNVKETLKTKFERVDFEIFQLSPSLISHGGPGSIVIQAIRK